MKFKLAVIGCISVLGFTGIAKSVHSLYTYHNQFPKTIIKLTTDDLEPHWSDAWSMDYPKEANIHYHLPVDSPLLNDDVIYALKGSAEDFWEIDVLRKTKDGYVMEHGDESEDGFAIEDLREFGYNGYFTVDEPKGTFTVYFEEYDAFDDFMDELEENGPWKDVFIHMTERKGGLDENTSE